MKKLIRHLTAWAWRDTIIRAQASQNIAMRYHHALYRIGVLRHKNPHTIAKDALDGPKETRKSGQRQVQD